MVSRDVLAAAANGKQPWTKWPLRMLSALVVTALAAATVGGAVAISEVPLLQDWQATLQERYVPIGSVEVGVDRLLFAIPFALLVGGGAFLGFLRWGWRVQRLRLGEWDSVRETNRYLEATLAEATQREDALITDRAGLTQQVDGLATEVESTRQELTTTLNRLTEINVEFDTYRRQNAVEAFDLQTMRTELDDTRTTLGSLRDEVSKSDDVVANLRNQIQLRDSELEDTQLRLAEKEAHLFQVESELSAARAELTLLQDEVNQGHTRIKVLETQLDLSVTTRTDRLEENGQVTALQGEVAGAIAQAEDVAAQLVVANERATHLETKLAETADEMQSLHGELAARAGELAAARDCTTGLQRELAQERALREALEAAETEATERIAAHEAQLQDLLLATSRRDRLEADLLDTQRQLADAERQSAANRNRVGTLEGELMAAEARTESLRGQLALALRQTAELSVLQSELEGTKFRVTGLQSQLTDAIEQSSALQFQLAGSEAQVERLQNDLGLRGGSQSGNGSGSDSEVTIDLREQPEDDSVDREADNVVSLRPRIG